jgi:hypothetical protein
MSVNLVSKDVWEIHVSEPRQQGCVEDHVSKYTWHNQKMTSVKRKLARAMSTSDVSELRHSGRIASGVSNVKSYEVPKDEDLKFLSTVDLRIHRELGQPLDPGEEHVPHEDHVSKTTSAMTRGAIRH